MMGRKEIYVVVMAMLVPMMAQCQRQERRNVAEQPQNVSSSISYHSNTGAVLPKERQWHAGQVLTDKDVAEIGIDNCFKAMQIPDDVFKRMNGKSFHDNPYIKRSDLRYLRLLHRDASGGTLTGEMVCNKAIANDLVDIFRQLYKAKYPIERIQLVDDYNADDELSMRANNTSCFNYRNVPGTRSLSKHSLGKAVDINTLYNPFVRTRNGRKEIMPATAKRYTDRSKSYAYTIHKGDLLYRLFVAHGFTWGGSWRYSKDYQHFEKK